MISLIKFIFSKKVKMMKWVFATIPGTTHSDVLWRMANAAYKRGHQVAFVYVSWINYHASYREPDDRLCWTLFPVTEIMTGRSKTSTDPTVFNESRAACPHLNAALQNYLTQQAPHVVVYDYFCVEVARLCHRLSIPAVVSVSGNLQRNTKFPHATLDTGVPCADSKLYREALYVFWRPYHIEHSRQVLAQFDMRRGDNVLFPGTCQSKPSDYTLDLHDKPLVYISMGTVIPNSMDHVSDMMELYVCLLEYMTTASKYRTYRYLFVTSSLQIQSRFEQLDIASFGIDVQFKQHVNQWRVLNDPMCQLFITHGGSHSFAEALEARVPMLVVPFFGNQWATGNEVASCQLGLCVSSFDTMKHKLDCALFDGAWRVAVKEHMVDYLNVDTIHPVQWIVDYMADVQRCPSPPLKQQTHSPTRHVPTDALFDRFLTMLHNVIMIPALYDSRVKGDTDHYAHRFVFYTIEEGAHMYKCCVMTFKKHITHIKRSMQHQVTHLYYKSATHLVEIQLWPYTYLRNFIQGQPDGANQYHELLQLDQTNLID